MTNNPRYAALLILETVRKKNLTLDLAVDKILESEPRLSRRDRALTSALVYGVMRWQAHLDWIIAHFSKTPLTKIDPQVLNILRLGVFQIKFLSRIPDSAAVNTSVQMAKSAAGHWVVRYVNGVLRNVAREAGEHFSHILFPDMQTNPSAALAAYKSFPEWLVKRWIERFGIRQTETLCDVINSIPPITVRTNTLITDRLKLLAALEPETRNIKATPYSAEGVSFDHPLKSIPETEAFQNGWFQVQDEAAQLIAPFINPKPGETVLDACAGLGGKTGHLAQIMQNSGTIVALDHDNTKLQRLSQEMKRLGVTIVRPVPHDLKIPLKPEEFGRFDRVLLDAPCSGLGVIRRNPDSKWSESKRNLKRYGERQIRFLSHLAPLVKPAGILTFAVCSTEPEENETVVKKFLEDHPEFDIEHSGGGLTPEARALMNENGFLRTFPHLHDMDGFFSVCFKRLK